MNILIKSKIYKAFTLIELLVVIAIVGILSGLIIVGMSSSVQSANIAKAQIFSASLRDSLLMNMVSEWKLDQAVSDITPDSWSANNCTLTGIGGLPQLQTSGCVYNNCISFDGVDDYLNCGSGNNLSILDAITVEAWVKRVGGNSYNTWNTIVGHTTWSNSFWFEINTNRTVSVNLEGVVAYGTAKTTKTVTDGAWTHLAFTYDKDIGADNLKIYINGVAEKVLTLTGSIGAPATSFKIGTAQEGSGTPYTLNGVIDNVRVFNVSVHSSQIKEQYYAGLNRLLASGILDREEYPNRIFHINE